MMTEQFQVMRRFLILELTIFVLRLPTGVQDTICLMWNFRDFPKFYSAIAKDERSTYYNYWDGWSISFREWPRKDLGGVSLQLDPWVDDPLFKAWEYGMCNRFEGDWPRSDNCLFNHFTQFQKRVFHLLEPWGKKHNVNYIRVYPACIEIENNLPKAAHQLIYFTLEEEIFDRVPFMSLKKPTGVESPTNLISDPTIARAMGFFHIYQLLKNFQNTECAVFKYGYTTIIASPSAKILLSNIIKRTDSVSDYLSNILDGKYQTKRGHDCLIDYLINWDLEFSSNIIEAFQDDDPEQFAQDPYDL